MNRLAALTGMTKYVVLAIAACGIAGCAEQDSHSSGNVSDRQDAAMKDPFAYGPSEGKSNAPADATGQPAKRDDSLKGEWNRFWNP